MPKSSIFSTFKLQSHDRFFWYFFCKNIVKAGTLTRALSLLTVLARLHIVFKSVAIDTKRRLASGDLRATLRKKEKERARERETDNLPQLRASGEQGFFEQEGEVGGRGGGGVGVGVGAARGRREGGGGRQIRNRRGSVGSNPVSASLEPLNWLKISSVAPEDQPEWRS